MASAKPSGLRHKHQMHNKPPETRTECGAFVICQHEKMMLDATTIITALSLIVVLAPTMLLLVLGLPSLVERPLREELSARAARWSVGVALVAAIGMFFGMLLTGDRHVILELGNWVAVGGHRRRHSGGSLPALHLRRQVPVRPAVGGVPDPRAGSLRHGRPLRL